MAAVQIDETELLQYRQLHGAAQAMLANPKARKLLQQAQLTVNPQAKIPEVEMEAERESALADIKKQNAEVLAALEADRAERAREKQMAELTAGWEKQKSELRQRGFTDDGIAKIEAHALQESIPNLRAAANDYLALNPPAMPEQPSGFGGWDFFGGEKKEDDQFVEKMIASRGDNDGVLNAEIMATLRDMRGQNGAGR
jgi:hypothetical protein